MQSSLLELFPTAVIAISVGAVVGAVAAVVYLKKRKR
jgi:hypothetical protein